MKNKPIFILDNDGISKSCVGAGCNNFIVATNENISSEEVLTSLMSLIKDKTNNIESVSTSVIPINSDIKTIKIER